MEIERIINLLNRVYHKNAWHGPSITEVIHDITEPMAFKEFPNTHTIVELVMHMASWRQFVCERLEGNLAFIIDDVINFPRPKNWEDAKVTLAESQERLMNCLNNFSESKLNVTVQGQDDLYDYYTIIHGLLHHDLYHTGQISLLKKMQS